MITTRELLKRYGTQPVPRYTSYPSANHWTTLRGVQALANGALEGIGARPLSLYVHVPFCHRLCLYCGCNMLVTRQVGHVERYLAALELELELVLGSIRQVPPVVQLHFGGGTPTYLSSQQLKWVVRAIGRRFPFGAEIEASIEVHPPVTTEEQLATLRALGFNRVSMGVQDFDPDVQARIHRLQPFEQTRDLMKAARRHGFVSQNVDLMYGLPLQTVPKFDRTLDRIEELMPDRVALFGYAHVPRMKRQQGSFRSSELPTADERLQLLEHSIRRLTKMGYRYVGLDHFALPGDELVRAQQSRTLRRNFMGYTTCARTDVLAFGPSAISDLGGIYWQNEKSLDAWCARVGQGRLPIERAWRSTPEDALRRRVIESLFCDLELVYDDLRTAEGVDFTARFAAELEALSPLEEDGLVERRADRLKVTNVGQLFLRNVASVFDAYLRREEAMHAPAI